jgi:hypothetical protein
MRQNRHMMRRLGGFGALAVLCGVLAGCGEETGAAIDAGAGGEDGGGCGAAVGERLLPLAVGNRWTYRVTDQDGTVVDKKTSVEAYEDAGGRKAGTMAFRIRTEKTDGVTVSWQQDRCDAVARHHEQGFLLDGGLESDEYYQPYKLRIDETEAHVASGASWVLGFTEVAVDPVTKAETSKAKTETWSVEGVGEVITVPAGTFTCLHVRKVGLEDGQADKQFWFAPGVGKVKEVGSQTEELVEYEVEAE